MDNLWNFFKGMFVKASNLSSSFFFYKINLCIVFESQAFFLNIIICLSNLFFMNKFKLGHTYYTK